MTDDEQQWERDDTPAVRRGRTVAELRQEYYARERREYSVAGERTTTDSRTGRSIVSTESDEIGE